MIDHAVVVKNGDGTYGLMPFSRYSS